MNFRELIRVVPTIDGTIGRFGRFFSFEEEDQDNEQNISSIPTGAFICERYVSEKFGETFRVLDVPGRSGIVFHPINTEEDTRGCIGLGLGVGFLYRNDEDTGERIRKLAVLNSRVAHQAFMSEMAGIDRFTLLIKDFR